ncbi:MAG: DUF1456 family protein [Bacteroidia bacterium]|nr:DUF1456 family protein [Sphingobacteriaceae bacterium]MBP9069482.1 DUF1456 family protein [Bacteroidia bacterium]
MTTNDIIRRLRFAFEFKDAEMIDLFESAGLSVNRTQINNWLLKEDDESFEEISNHQLAYFLNGLIIYGRGKKEGPPPVAETNLNNNIILRKLKIALNYKDEDILEILEIEGMRISKHELSAFFRKPGQDQYRECKDQILRKFIYGLQVKHRGDGKQPL